MEFYNFTNNSCYSSLNTTSDTESIVDYTYISNNILDTDQIDEILKLYEPEIVSEEINKFEMKTKKSVWKRFLFLFCKNKK